MSRYLSVLKDAAIAVVRTDRLGDMVLTLPLCRAIKSEFPDSKVVLVTRKYSLPLLYKCPVIDQVVLTDDFPKGIKSIFKSNNFDVAFFPRPRLGEVLPACTNGVRYRVGSAYRAYSFLFNKKVYDHRKEGVYHEAEYNVRLLSQTIGKDLPAELVKPEVNPAAFEYVETLLHNNNISQGEYIILHPGSGGSSRDWKPASFASLAGLLAEKTKFSIITTGIAGESTVCGIVAKSSDRIVNLCGKLDLWQMIALLSGGKLLVANSTGVLHIASALGIAVAGLFPNTSHIGARRWGPYSACSAVISPPLTDNSPQMDNMDLIKPETVYKTVLKLIKS